MIKIVQARWLKGYQIDLTFSNSNVGVYDFAALLDQMTPLTRPLQDPVAFQKYFLELGALCWPNGLQISADKLHTELFRSQSVSQ